MRAVCVYCGSSAGASPDYENAAIALADELLRRGLALVYGGANKGTMGILANAMLAGGGRVIGVIPRLLLEKEIAHESLTEQHVVESMHERKALMAEFADAFVALPGGFGTLEEIIETVTWAQLGLHAHPCGLLNVNGYFDALLAYLAHAEAEEFLRPPHRQMLLVDTQPAALLEQFATYRAPRVAKWRD
ncbi:MAG TPA: TIGR00730 family Rossman fold protein [Woeseiaceae bacterium]|nr:TIGR00730 family Rossman fold protein [Woeseiaceae bacterium]